MSKPIVEPLKLGRRKKTVEKPKKKSPDELSDLSSLLYEIMTDEAQEKFYINDAPKPAWIILSKYSMLTKTKSKYELWFSTIASWQFHKISECHDKIKEMVAKANTQVKVWIETRSGKRTLFAEKKEASS